MSEADMTAPADRGATEESEDKEIVRAGSLLGGRQMLRVMPKSRMDAHRLIEHGLPRPALIYLVSHLRTLRASKSLEGAIGLSIRTLQRAAKEGAQVKRLDVAQSSRTWQFAKILGIATEVFGNQDRAEAWMDTPAMALDQQKPIDLIRTPEGVAMVEVLLRRMEYGVYT